MIGNKTKLIYNNKKINDKFKNKARYVLRSCSGFTGVGKITGDRQGDPTPPLAAARGSARASNPTANTKTYAVTGAGGWYPVECVTVLGGKQRKAATP